MPLVDIQLIEGVFDAKQKKDIHLGVVMFRHVLRTTLITAFLAPVLAHAGPACLPKSVFPQDENDSKPKFYLGFDDGAPTLCAPNDQLELGMAGCWKVDPATGELSASQATSLRGHAQSGLADANGCIEGYCPPAKSESSEARPPWVVSTDGRHVAIIVNMTLYIFDATSKSLTQTILLQDEKAPDTTNVSNSPVDILYIGNTIYVVGSDAGPFIGVWRYGDDGKRLGVVTLRGKEPKEAGDDYLSVFGGTANLLDEHHVGVADPGMKKLIIFSEDGKRQEIKRAVDLSACIKDEIDNNLNVGDLGSVSVGCKKVVATDFEPYFDLNPIRLPSGDLLSALSGKFRGSLAIFDGKTLAIKKRWKLPRCSK